MNAWIYAAPSVLLGLALGGLLGGGLATLRARQRSQQEQAQAIEDALDAAVDQAVAQAVERERAQAGLTAAVVQERLRALQEERAQLQQDLLHSRQEGSSVRQLLEQVREERAELAGRAARLPELEQALREAGLRIEALHASSQHSQTDAAAQLAELNTRLEAERRQAAEKVELLRAAREEMTLQFKTLASDILEEKSKRFTEQNQSQLGQLLDPLRSRLQEFQGKVEQFYVAEGQQRSALAQQVVQLQQLNQMLSEDARNLTQALKGSAKSQGNWGELILERVLEASGLRRGMEYAVQESHVREDGTRVQPDVVIHLPEERHLVVDAKVSLLAYEDSVHASDESARASAQRRHLESVKAHIKGLSTKNYQQLYGLQSLDFVLMFVPIEPAFMAAIAADSELFMDAWDRNVLLVSPSTLLFVVRTVAHLWRQEAQTRNAQDIAKRGAELYDRLVGFTADLEKLGERLRLAQDSYASAYDKLARRKGNVIRQAELLRGLGVKPSKQLSKALRAELQDDEASADTASAAAMQAAPDPSQAGEERC
jgi:DNA recombination protein RmuC